MGSHALRGGADVWSATGCTFKGHFCGYSSERNYRIVKKLMKRPLVITAIRPRKWFWELSFDRRRSDPSLFIAFIITSNTLIASRPAVTRHTDSASGVESQIQVNQHVRRQQTYRVVQTKVKHCIADGNFVNVERFSNLSHFSVCKGKCGGKCYMHLTENLISFLSVKK